MAAFYLVDKRVRLRSKSYVFLYILHPFTSGILTSFLPPLLLVLHQGFIQFSITFLTGRKEKIPQIK